MRELAAPGCHVPVPEAWEQAASTSNQLEQTSVFRGPTECDWLVVSLMAKADPERAMNNWVDPLVGAIGLPSAQPKGWMGALSLLGWERIDGDATADLSARLECDDVLAYTGAVKSVAEGSAAQLCRIYVVCARRGSQAWKLSLGLASACPPGVPEDMIASNDHVRAAAVFGGLRLGT